MGFGSSWIRYSEMPILNRKLCTNYRGKSLLSLQGKVYAKCLERKCREMVESKLKDGQYGFCRGRSTTNQIFSLGSKSSKNLGSMAKISLHAFSILKKYMTEFLRINFERFCGSTALLVSCYTPLSHCTVDRRFVFGKTASNQRRSMWALDSGRGTFRYLSCLLFT